MKKHFSTISLVIILIIGLSLMLYPTFSDYWNSLHQSWAITNYASVVANMNDDTYDEIWEAAYSYNASLLARKNSYLINDEQKLAYEELLNVDGNGVMGYIDIPSIDVTLPIYHGTGDDILQYAIGHMEWTSLPVGGENSHCVVSGHRGLPSARLFTDLDQLAAGDIFMLQVLDEILTYEVERILIVEPDDTDDLLIEEGEDLCTLVTCTPYGVNTHRLLVTGHRVETQAEVRTIRVTADAIQIEPVLIAPLLAAPILILLLIALMIPKQKR